MASTEGENDWCTWKCAWSGCDMEHSEPCSHFAVNKPFCSLDCIAEAGAEAMRRAELPYIQADHRHQVRMTDPGLDPDRIAHSFDSALVRSDHQHANTKIKFE